jgi:hypothetical protein
MTGLLPPLAAFVAALWPALVLLLLVLKIDVAQGYGDFIVGSLAWYRGAKGQDLLAGPVAVAAFLALAAWHRRIQATLVRHQGPAVAERYTTQLLWWCLPAMVTGAAVLMGSPLERGWVLVSALGLVVLAAAVQQQLKRHEVADPERASLALVTGLLAGAWPLALACALGRLLPHAAPMVERWMSWAPRLALAGLVLGALLAFMPGARLQRLLRWALALGQAALPLLLMGLLPPQLVAPGGQTSPHPMTPLLPALVALLVLAASADVLRRAVRHPPPGAAEGSAALLPMLSPWAWMALLIALRVGTASPPQVSADDYHFGERLLGMMAYRDGAWPYVDYLPPHGLVEDDLGTALSLLFHDGLAGTALEGARLAFALLGGIAFLALRARTGSLVLAFAAVALIGTRAAWLLLVPAWCLWTAPTLLARPGRWLLAWMASVPLLVLAAPPFGVVAAVASAPLAAVSVRRWWAGATGARAWPVGLVTGAVVLLAISPVGAMLVAAVRYVLENGAVNQVAYGIPWAISWGAAPPQGLLFEAVRMSWLVVLAWCSLAAWRLMRSGTVESAGWLVPASAALMCLLLLPYAMGRIDPSALSRPGQVAGLAWALLLPLALWSQWRGAHQAAGVLLVVTMASALNPAPVSLSTLVNAAAPRIGSGPAKDGRAEGLPGLGPTLVEDAQWARLRRVQAVLSERLAAGESYLDLTNRNAQYAYLGRPAPVAVTAPYNMVSPRQQQRDVDALRKRPPRMALLAADAIVHDGGGLALRTPLLYRHVVEHYAPRMAKGLIVADLVDPLQPPGDELAADQALLFERAFAVDDYAEIPQSWGRSEDRLRARMKPVRPLDASAWRLQDVQALGAGRYRITGPRPSLTLTLADGGIDGRRAGLLRMTWHCAAQLPAARWRIEWWGGLGTTPEQPAGVALSAGSGTLLVPLDAQPRWLLMRRVDGLRLNLAGASGCQEVQVADLALLQRSVWP